jgi:hypothetical protein
LQAWGKLELKRNTKESKVKINICLVGYKVLVLRLSTEQSSMKKIIGNVHKSLKMSLDIHISLIRKILRNSFNRKHGRIHRAKVGLLTLILYPVVLKRLVDFLMLIQKNLCQNNIRPAI